MLTLELEDPKCEGSLREIALKVRSSKRTVVVAGAGISSNAGIPDFRSKDGLYNLVKKEYKATFVKGKDLFDVITFRDAKTTEIFYSFMVGLRNATVLAQPTPTHHLMKLLKDKKKLMRCYTQNIDGLESRVGLGKGDIVQLHGDIHNLKCMNCSQKFTWSTSYTEQMSQGEGPACENCMSVSLARTLSGKRSTAVGKLRPDIVLYGEDHPTGDEISAILQKDCSKSPQLLLVIGTSLKVIGVKNLVKSLAQATHAAGGIVVFVNKTPLSKSEWGRFFDYHIMSDSDGWVANVKQSIPSFFEVQTKLSVDRKRKVTTTAKSEFEERSIKKERDLTGDPSVSLAKRTKSDSGMDILQPIALPTSPQTYSVSSQSTEDAYSSPSLISLTQPDDIPELKLE